MIFSARSNVLTRIHACSVQSPGQLDRFRIVLFVRFLEQTPQMSKQLFPEEAQPIPESLALRYRIFRDPAAAGEFVEILARIDRSVHRFQHPGGWNGERESRLATTIIFPLRARRNDRYIKDR